ncbi:hypothetical protein ACS0TY_025848 [Phlomoides rotata]
MALPDGILSTEELLDAQSHIWNHTYSFINSMSLKCAVELKIPDIIHNHNKPTKLSELANALSINQAKTPCLGRLMRILIHSKFFIMAKIDEEEEDEGYWLTPASRLLRRDEPLSIAPFVLCGVEPIMATDPGHRMSEWFRDDEPTPFVTTHGRTFWEIMGEDPRLNKVFNQSMSSDTQMLMSVIAKGSGNIFQELESMVDVGGGTGTMARLIVHAFPGLKCTVLDHPHVVQGLQGTHNLKYTEGDMFKAIPSAQAVSLKFILHDWSDEECIQILKKCKEAIPSKEKGGKVIVIDIVVGYTYNQKDYTETQLLMDMMMMILLTGKERTEEEWANIFHAAGFTTYKITPILGLKSIIEVFP